MILTLAVAIIIQNIPILYNDILQAGDSMSVSSEYFLPHKKLSLLVSLFRLI